MGFLDLFRPKWKHSDADVRAEAVKQLGDEDERLLAEVLRRDPDARVRRIALKKVDDAQLLGEVAESDPDQGLRSDAAEKVTSVLLAAAIADGDEARSLNALSRLKLERAVAEVAKRGAYESVRKQALTRLADAKAIADVARRSDDPHIRRQAVESVKEQAQLREIAINDATKEVALAAVARLDDLQALENVVKKTKLKAVKNAARERLEQVKEWQRPKEGGLSPEKRKAQLALMCRSIEEAAASDDFAHAERAFELAKKELAELGVNKGEESFQKRYDRAWLKFQARAQEKNAVERARAAAEVKRQREAEEAKQRDAKSAEQEAEDAKLREIADAARKEENEKRAVERARRSEEKAQRDAQKATEKAERDKQWAAERERKDQEAIENARRYEEAVVRLETLEADADRKVIEAALKSTDDLMKSIGKLPKEKMDLRDRHQAARGKIVIRLQEMRESEDWKRWANVPRLEALVAKAEALVTAASAEGADLKAAGADLKALQTEWKTVGPAPKDKSEALWKRFKAAGDQVFEKVKGQRAAGTDEERAANLAKKEELCTRVAALAATPDDQINWKETAETIKTLQEEWKGVGPVAKEQSDALWKRFRGSCDQFFDRRKARFGELDQERAANLQRFEGLIARAEQLAAVPDDKINWKDTADQLKGLQAEWKNVGAAPKDQSEAIWNRFRAACDSFFERRKKHFDQMDEERAANLKKKELLCEKAEALKDADDHQAAITEVKKLQAEWKTVGPAPKDQADAVWERFRGACDVVYEGKREPEPELPAPTHTGPLPKFEHKAFAGIADKLAPQGTPVPAPVTKQTETLAEAASGWEDIAASVEDKKPEDK